MYYTSEVRLTLEKPKPRPPLPVVKDTIPITNKVNTRPSIPTVNETICLDKSYGHCSNRNPKQVDKYLTNIMPEEHESDKKINEETKLFILKKKKERDEKSRLNLLEKQKFAEERKKKLEQLRETTTKLAKASAKKKIIHDKDECKTEKTPKMGCKIKENFPTQSNRQEVDQTWSPIPKAKNEIKNITFKKTIKGQKKVKKDLENTHNNDECLNVTKNIENRMSTSPEVSNYLSTNQQPNSNKKKTKIRDVTKPENLFSKLKLNDDYNLIINDNLFSVSIPKVDHSISSFVDKDDNNIKLVENICQDDGKPQTEDIISLNREISNPNLSVKPIESITIDTGTLTDPLLARTSSKELISKIDHFVELQAKLFDQCLPSKKCSSESTQTDNFNDPSALFSSKMIPPPLNFMSVFKSKLNLIQMEKNDLDFTQPESNRLTSKSFYTNKGCSHNNIESDVLNKPDVKNVGNDKIIHAPNQNHNDQVTNKKYKSALIIDEETNSSPIKRMTENNIGEEKTSNSKLFTKPNEITNEDLKEVLEKMRYDHNFLSKNSSCNNNDLSNTFTYSNISINGSSDFPGIHDEFQAELDTLDQLNNSLCDIENMGCDISKISKEKLVDKELNSHCGSNDLNFKKVVDVTYSNNIRSTSISNVNAVSSNMVYVDNTITGFSIQMFEQLIKDEELRAKQHHTILSLKERSLINRLKWEHTMCDIQLNNLKNRPGHDKQIQLFKQKHRGSVKKLEHSLLQVKKLGKVIDSVYKQRITMLESHLLHLRMQSSSKQVIRKLKTLDHIPIKDEFSLPNSHVLKHYDKTDYIDTVKGDQIDKNSSQRNDTAKKSTTLSSILKLDHVISPIIIESELSKQVRNVQNHTNVGPYSQSTINKSIKTSKNSNKNIINKDTNLFVPIDLSCLNKSSDVNGISKKVSVPNTLQKSPPKLSRYPSETSISTNSVQSDMDTRIATLQEQLEARKLESLRLKKEQKRLRLENLKAKEQDLLKQIESYDRKIEESKKSLMIEIESRNMQVTKSLKIIDTSSSKTHSPNSHESDIKMTTDKEKYINYTAFHEPSNYDTPIKPQHEIVTKPKLKHIEYSTSNNINKQRILQSLETNHDIVSSLKEPTSMEVNNTKESLKNLTNANSTTLKYQSEDALIDTSCNLSEKSKAETCLDNINDIGNSIEVFSYNYSVSNQEISNTSDDPELNSVKKNIYKKLKYSLDDITRSHSTLSSSNNSSIQRQFSVEPNVTDSNMLDEHYSPDFTSDENSSELHKLSEFSKHDANAIESLKEIQNNESSYEEERSEGDVMFEDKTFIEQNSDSSDSVYNEKPTDGQVEYITNKIFKCLLKDLNTTLKSSLSKPSFLPKKNNLNNLFEKETPLIMSFNHEEQKNKILLSEKAITISDALLESQLLPIVSSSLQMYLPQLNKGDMEKLTQYLNWSSKRKKLELLEFLNFHHKTNDIDSESFEMFYQKYQEQKKSQTFQDESNSDVMLSQTQQEAEKLKIEQMRIEEEIDRLRMSEETQFFIREIPNKPPPPYKSPTKKKALFDMPYSSTEIHEIVLAAATQLFNNSQNLMSEDCINDPDSNSYDDYKTLIFDYCKEIAEDIFFVEKNVPIWIRPLKKLKHFRAKPKNPKDLCDIVIKKLSQIIDTDDCEKKVNKFVIKQMYNEDDKWTDFHMDEMNILNDIVNNLMKKMVCETITNIKTNFYLKFF